MKLLSHGTTKGYPVVVWCATLPVDIRNGEGFGSGHVVGWLPIVSCFILHTCQIVESTCCRFLKMPQKKANSDIRHWSTLYGMKQSSKSWNMPPSTQKLDICTRAIVAFHDGCFLWYWFFRLTTKSSESLLHSVLIPAGASKGKLPTITINLLLLPLTLHLIAADSAINLLPLLMLICFIQQVHDVTHTWPQQQVPLPRVPGTIGGASWPVKELPNQNRGRSPRCSPCIWVQ